MMKKVSFPNSPLLSSFACDIRTDFAHACAVGSVPKSNPFPFSFVLSSSAHVGGYHCWGGGGGGYTS